MTLRCCGIRDFVQITILQDLAESSFLSGGGGGGGAEMAAEALSVCARACVYVCVCVRARVCVWRRF